METLKGAWDFFQNEVLGMNWLNRLIETFLNTCGLDTTGKIGGSIQFFIYDIISFCMVRNSAISISRTGLGGIACSRIRFCRKSFALLTILRNRPGSQPFFPFFPDPVLPLLKSCGRARRPAPTKNS